MVACCLKVAFVYGFSNFALLCLLQAPSETHGTLHYADASGATVAFEIPPSATSAEIVYKRGPDCGILEVVVATTAGETETAVKETTLVDSFSRIVEWEAIAPLNLPLDAREKQQKHHVQLRATGRKNVASEHDYVQIVAVNVFFGPGS